MSDFSKQNQDNDTIIYIEYVPKGGTTLKFQISYVDASKVYIDDLIAQKKAQITRQGHNVHYSREFTFPEFFAFIYSELTEPEYKVELLDRMFEMCKKIFKNTNRFHTLH